jgi:hypothetical protein
MGNKAGYCSRLAHLKKIKKKFHKKQTKQSRAILLAILAYVQTGLKKQLKF